MSRITRDEMLMQVAFVVSRRSTCNRLQVGSVIAQNGRIVSTGYAGSPSGMPHCSPETCNPHNPCTQTVHAEAGAITYAARSGIRLEGSTLYCTHAPCAGCSRLIINCGIIKVLYQVPYRLTEGLELLTLAGISVDQLNVPLPINLP